MEKTLASILIDFNQTQRKAGDLEELAEKLEEIADQDMEKILGTLGKAWTGEASRQYLEKGKSLERKIRESAARLKKIAAAMRKTAKITYNAERQAVLLAQTRK